MNPKLIALAATVAALAGVSTAQAQSTVRPSQPNRPEIRALVLRSEALNAHYGLGSDATALRALRLRGAALNARNGLGSDAPALRAIRLRGAAFNARYVVGSDAAALRALRLRGEAMNARYVPASGGGSPVGWAGFGIAGATLGAIALLVGGFAARRARETGTAAA